MKIIKRRIEKNSQKVQKFSIESVNVVDTFEIDQTIDNLFIKIFALEVRKKDKKSLFD